MDNQPTCGCPIPVINPPDFGMGERIVGAPPYPADPGGRFPRVMTASAGTGQSTSLACEPAAGCGWKNGSQASAGARYGIDGLDRAEGEIAALLARIRYPVPGIWLGPALIHLPSGNLVLQISAPRCGPLDPVPVFTYNSLAACHKAYYGHGVADLFNPSIELDEDQATVITGTGRCLVYSDVVAGGWAAPPDSARNALKQEMDLTWTERQPDGLLWRYNEDGCLKEIASPSGGVWTVVRDEDSVTITAPNGRVTSYNASGITQPGSRFTALSVIDDLLTGVTWPDGGHLALGYSDGALLTSITDSAGRVASYEYDCQDRVASLTTPENHTYRYDYFQEEDAQGEETFWIEVTDPAGQVTTVIHDCNAVQAVVDPLGHRTTYIWEGEGDSRLSAIVDPKGHQTSLGYTTLSNKTRALSSITRPVVGTFQFGFGSNDRCNSITDYDGHPMALDWDTYENRSGVLDAEGGRFTFLYNGERQVVGTIDPLTRRTTVTYDAAGNAETLANELNQITTLTYNAFGEATAVENPEQETTSYTRDAVGRVTAITNPLGHTASFTYADDGLLTRVENAELEATSYEYTGEKRLLSVTDPLGQATTFGYDSRGLLEREENAEHEATTHVYDIAGRRNNTINPLGHLSTFVYDAAGNRTEVTNPEQETTKSVYDDADRVIAVIDPLLHTTTYDLNGAGLPTAVTNAESEITVYGYDNLYRPITVTDPLGHATTTDYDPLGRPVAVTNAENETITTVYDPAGQAVTVTNAELETTAVGYDAAGRPITTTTPLGHVTTTVYDNAGRVVATIDPLSRWTTTAYDKADRPVAVTNAKLETTTTVYDNAGRVIAIVDPLNHATTTAYDNANRPTAVINAELETVTTVYDAAGRAVEVVNPLGHITTTTYDKADRPTAVTNAELETTTTVYDAAGRATQVIDPLYHVTTTLYDNANRPTTVTNAENETSFTNYDAAGRVIEVSDPLGRVTTTVYDDANRPIAVTNAELETTTTIYDDAGRVVGIINPLGLQTTFTYDADGRQTETINPELEITTTVYDAAGQAIATIDPLGHATTTSYDLAGRPEAVFDPLGHVATTVYDDAGRTVATIDANGDVATTLYDNADRPVVAVDPEGRRVTTVYDNAGRAVALINENNQATTTVYDNANRPVERINPLGQATTFVYDDAGRQVQRIDARAQTASYTYDGANRPTGRQYPDGTRATIVYDNAGNRTLLEDWTGQYAYGYDNVNRILTAAAPGGTITYDYNAAGWRTGMTDPDGGTFTYTHDAVGRLIGIVNPDIEVTTLGYDAAGRNTSKQLHNGTSAEMIYDAAGRQERVVNKDSAAATISSFDYEFDNVGRRMGVADDSGGYTNWTYDRTGQLTNDVSFPSGTGPSWARLTLSQWSGLSVDSWAALPVDAVPEYGYQYVYDPAGNRLTRTDPESGAVVTSTYDNANRLLTSEDVNGTTTYTYDANGNQLTIEEPSGDVTTNTWDGENRLIQVEHPDFSITTYAYNADGLKVEADDGIETTRFLYDGNNLLRETDDIGIVEAGFTYVPMPYAHLVSQQRDSASIFHHFDGIRDTRQLTDAAGVVTDEYSHNAWGELKSSTGATPNSHTFKGQLLAYYGDPNTGPEASIYSLHYRDYIASQGRLRSADPAKARINDYTYCENDPVNRSDPSGLLDFWDLFGGDEPGRRSRLIESLAEPGQEAVTAGSARGQVQQEAWADYAKGAEIARRIDAAVGETLEAIETADRITLDLLASFTPIVSDLRDLQELITGTDLINQQKLGLVDRMLVVVGVCIPYVNGRHLRAIKTMLVKLANWLAEAVRRVDFKRHVDRLRDAIQNLLKRLDDASGKTSEAGEANPEQFSEFIDEPANLPGSGRVPSKQVAPIRANADPRKFMDYIFKEGATHGKDKVFHGLGYGKEHSDELLEIWQKQAAEKYARGDYVLGKADQYGQRIDIEIELPGIGDAAGKTSYLRSGWMIQPDGTIKLNTPFTGFTR